MSESLYDIINPFNPLPKYLFERDKNVWGLKVPGRSQSGIYLLESPWMKMIGKKGVVNKRSKRKRPKKLNRR